MHIEYAIRNISAGEFWSLDKSSVLNEYDTYIPEELRKKLKGGENTLNLYLLYNHLKERESQGKLGLFDN